MELLSQYSNPQISSKLSALLHPVDPDSDEPDETRSILELAQLSTDLIDHAEGMSQLPHRAKPKLKDRLASGVDLEITERYQSGESSTKLAKYFGIGKSSILKVLRNNNVEIRHQPMTRDQIMLAVKLYTDGLSLMAVGSRFNRSASAIQNVLIREGVERRTCYTRSDSEIN